MVQKRRVAPAGRDEATRERQGLMGCRPDDKPASIHNLAGFARQPDQKARIFALAADKNQDNAARMMHRWKPNVTVAAIVCQDGRFLLVEEQTTDGLKLNNPAGHLDPGESPVQGVVREALEETARVFTPEHVLGVYLSRFRHTRSGEDVTYLRLAFSGRVGEPDAQLKLDEGIVRAVWLTPEEIRASVEHHRSPLVLRCMEDHLSGRRLPLEAVYADPSLFNPPSGP